MRRTASHLTALVLLAGPAIASCSSKSSAPASAAAFCDSIKAASSRSSTTLSATPSPDELRVKVQHSVDDTKAAAAVAPAVIKDDMDVLAKATSAAGAELAKTDYKIQANSAANNPLGAADVVAARKRVSAYVAANCQLGSGGTSSN